MKEESYLFGKIRKKRLIIDVTDAEDVNPVMPKFNA